METIAVIYVNNIRRIDILDIEFGINNRVVYQWVTMNDIGEHIPGKIRRARLYNNNSTGAEYFMSATKRWFMGEAIRV